MFAESSSSMESIFQNKTNILPLIFFRCFDDDAAVMIVADDVDGGNFINYIIDDDGNDNCHLYRSVGRSIGRYLCLLVSYGCLCACVMRQECDQRTGK